MSRLLQIRVRLQDGSRVVVLTPGADGIPADAAVTVAATQKVAGEWQLGLETSAPGGEQKGRRTWVPVRTLGECNAGDRVLVELEGGWIEATVLPEPDPSATGLGDRR